MSSISSPWPQGFHHRFWTPWDENFLKLQSMLSPLRRHLPQINIEQWSVKGRQGFRDLVSFYLSVTKK